MQGRLRARLSSPMVSNVAIKLMLLCTSALLACARTVPARLVVARPVPEAQRSEIGCGQHSRAPGLMETRARGDSGPTAEPAQRAHLQGEDVQVVNCRWAAVLAIVANTPVSISRLTRLLANSVVSELILRSFWAPGAVLAVLANLSNTGANTLTSAISRGRCYQHLWPEPITR